MTLAGHAQTETDNGRTLDFDNSATSDFGEFLFDMTSMLNADILTLPKWDLGIFTPPADAPLGTRINPDAISFKPRFSFTDKTPSTFHSLLYPGSPASHNVPWQGASYKLNNGLRINTYGEYDADGYKRANPSAMPWQKNNFNAAFEIKSANGNFGIKVEVNAGRGY